MVTAADRTLDKRIDVTARRWSYSLSRSRLEYAIRL
jgi:hypothetical protein